MTKVLAAIFVFLKAPEGELPPDETPGAFLECSPTTSRAASTVWQWLAERSDISIGVSRKLNKLSLIEILRLNCFEPEFQNGETYDATLSAETTAQNVHGDGAAVLSETGYRDTIRVYASDDAMWESITGHGIDYKRLPRLEWVLLQGIASTDSQGILQGDLGRLVGQDKRSVPKRTDALVSKGYITKRTTLVRGTKTSKLWLKFLAPSIPQDSSCASEPATEIKLSRHILADTLDAVPWHTKWTNDSVDYTALATTIMATCKEWGVMRLQDLKAKLGVLGMKWQMKVVSKVCRFLSARGAIEYVAAKLDNRIFKDCIRFNRDLTARDWSIFLATGKRNSKWAKGVSSDHADGDLDSTAADRPSRIGRMSFLAQCPIWSADLPLSIGIANLLRYYHEQGLTNQDLCGMTVGQTFTRYISGLTGSLSSNKVQPAHLKHLCVWNEHCRIGKVASYRYYIGSRTGRDEFEARTSPHRAISEAQAQYGFHYPEGKPNISDLAPTLSESCYRGLAQQKKRGRPRKSSVRFDEQLEDRTKAKAVSAVKHGRDASERETRQEVNTILSRGASPDQDTAIGHEKSLIPPLNESSAPGKTVESNSSSIEGEYFGTAHMTEAQNSLPTTGKTRGSRLGCGRGKAQATRPSNAASEISESRPFKCGKCGGGWKNDLGLKYHLEKSKTPCNPSFKRPEIQEIRKPEKLKTSGESRSDTRKQTATNSSTDKLRHHDDIGWSASERTKGRSDTSLDASPKALRRVSRDPGYRDGSDTSAPGSRTKTIAPQEQNLLLVRTKMQPRQITAANNQVRSSKSERATSFDVKQKLSMAKDLTGNETEKPGDTVHSQATDHRTGASTAAAPQNKSTLDEPVSSRREGTKLHNDNIEKVLKEVLEQHGGCAPGGASLEVLFGETWRQCFIDQAVPKFQHMMAAVKRMLKQKRLAEHWHAFRARNGVFTKFQILMIPSLSAFSPEALNLVEKVKEVYPDPLNTSLLGEEPSSIPDKKVGGRGRRLLASDVAVLDAPVYAAQIITKRGLDLKTEVNSPGTKRRKLVDDYHATRRKLADASDIPGNWSMAQAVIPDMSSSLDLNTFLDTGIAVQVDYRRQEMSGQREDLVDRSEEESCALEDIEKDHVSTSHNETPEMSVCEKLTATLPRRGWLPGNSWYSWAADYQTLATRRQKLAANQSKHRHFMGVLQLCSDLEHEVNAASDSPSSPAPLFHKTFISFFGGTNRGLSSPIKWDDVTEEDSCFVGPATLAQDDGETCVPAEREDDTVSSSDTSSAGETAMAGVDVTQVSANAKRVVLIKRQLTNLPRKAFLKYTEKGANARAEVPDPDELMAAFIAVRTLLGGIEKTIDWGHLLWIFPDIGLNQLRRFWAAARKEKAPYIAKLTEDFQDRLLSALRNNELPMIDYKNVKGYDWKTLIRWTMRISNQDKLQIPASKQTFDQHFDVADGEIGGEDWREKFFHTQSSVFARFEAATLEPGALSLSEARERGHPHTMHSNIDVARSWVRSLCCTGETKYTPQDIKKKFSSLSDETPQSNNSSLRAAIDALTKERIICKSKKAPFGGRPYRLNESYTTALSKLSHRMKYQDAAAFKDKLDSAFRSRGNARVPYALEDGAVMALTNLSASRKIRIKTVKVPKIPFGFEPGNYESRKYPKSYYHLALQVEPTDSYEYMDDIDTIKSAKVQGPPLTGLGREIPQWVDFFGELDPDRWADLLGAFCFILNIRGPMSLDGICTSIAPTLEKFEAQLIRDWGLATGILKTWKSEADITLGEWWWLAVHKQRQPRAVSEDRG